MVRAMYVHLIDGTYELFRSFYGAPARKSSSGREVGATRSFLRSLRRFVDSPAVTHVACAFDTVIESFRNELFEGYKTGEGIDPDLLAQFPLVEKAAAALGVRVWSMIEFETDDGLATGAARFSALPEVERVFICSPDKDFAQCVDDKVVLWDRLRDVVYDRKGVIEKWGVPPESIPDYLALVGDSADGIPGVPKWGAKSTAKLLAHYGTVDAIPADPIQWQVEVRGAKGLAESLEAHRDVVGLYKTLATLRRDAPVSKTLAEIEYRGVDEEALAALELELD